MGSRLDKLRQVNLAAKKDELPVVKALADCGVETVWRTTGSALDNRIAGDVQFDMGGKLYSIEVQVATPGHVNFSYSDSKVKMYRGRVYENSYSLLGTYETKSGNDMIFAILPAKKLHEVLDAAALDLFAGRKPPNIFLQGGGTEDSYWVIRPEALSAMPETIFGASLEEVIKPLVVHAREMQYVEVNFFGVTVPAK